MAKIVEFFNGLLDAKCCAALDRLLRLCLCRKNAYEHEHLCIDFHTYHIASTRTKTRLRRRERAPVVVRSRSPDNGRAALWINSYRVVFEKRQEMMLIFYEVMELFEKETNGSNKAERTFDVVIYGGAGAPGRRSR
ncbi:hypothetical protein EVAR_6251_1 [Eumeta japonica]|uniref:Uncharacterized protein n=1 Tax=Eumeta variegata TaxID=151549 RepID=A0A4C1T945_EUMVA|nr:hypothetical protein EVAR_6251_1 [Eumeta japonica]